MAKKGTGKAGKTGSGWFEQSRARFREGFRDRGYVPPAPGGVWSEPELTRAEVSQSLLRPKSKPKPSPASQGGRGHVRVAVPPSASDVVIEIEEEPDDPAPQTNKKRGTNKNKIVVQQELTEKTEKDLRFENTRSLSFNPTRFCSMVLGRPIVVTMCRVSAHSICTLANSWQWRAKSQPLQNMCHPTRRGPFQTSFSRLSNLLLFDTTKPLLAGRLLSRSAPPSKFMCFKFGIVIHC